MAFDIELYSYFRSSASYRVRIALEYKNISYDYKPVHLLNNGGEQNKEEFKKINPMGQVPCMVHNGRVLAQSMAMIEYLDAVWPEPRLFPRDPFQAGLVRQACENMNSGIHPIQNLKVLKELEVRWNANQDDKLSWAAFWIRAGFQGHERFLQGSAGRYSVGDEVTAADMFLVPMVVNARRYKVDMKEFPLIEKVEAACMKIPAFVKAHPDRQPDTPKEG